MTSQRTTLAEGRAGTDLQDGRVLLRAAAEVGEDFADGSEGDVLEHKGRVDAGAEAVRMARGEQLEQGRRQVIRHACPILSAPRSNAEPREGHAPRICPNVRRPLS